MVGKSRRPGTTRHRLLEPHNPESPMPPTHRSSVPASLTAMLLLLAACGGTSSPGSTYPDEILVSGVAQNPEGIELDVTTESFFLSSLNAGPILRIEMDGSHTPFSSGEPFPLSTAGLQIDHARNRLLAAGFNGAELLDEDPETRGVSFLRIYDLDTGAHRQDVALSTLLPDAPAYFANDIAVDADGNAYISDWYAGVVYKVDVEGNASVFWTNTSVVPGGPNGLDAHPDGYLLVSVLNDPSYTEYALVKVPFDAPESAADVQIAGADFHGFDGMVLTSTGAVVGVTNDGASPGGNVLLELESTDGWVSANVTTRVAIPASTTVARTADDHFFVINQDFSDGAATSWTIQQIPLR